MSRPRILVADDNPISLQFFVEALASFDFECIAASDGLAALACAKSSKFDLLVLDARMPGLGGAEALGRIRSLTGPNQAVAALATSADSATCTALLAAGFAEVLLKPMGVEALREAMARHLDPASATPMTDWLDDTPALHATGGDARMVSALRGLFAAELDALPAEVSAMRAQQDARALLDRMHRLDASAGFCGATAIQRASVQLRQSAASGTWPDAAVAVLLDACARTRGLLAPSGRK